MSLGGFQFYFLIRATGYRRDFFRKIHNEDGIYSLKSVLGYLEELLKLFLILKQDLFLVVNLIALLNKGEADF